MDKREKKKIVSIYSYRDELGAELYQVVRFSDKSFAVRVDRGRRHYDWKAPDRHVPYNLPQVVKASLLDVVYVVEGEKDADTLTKLGLIATTNRGGTGNTKLWEEYPMHFAGRTVCILPDNDEPGMKHAKRVRELLEPVATDITVLRLPDLGHKEDVTDWIEKHGGTLAQLQSLTEAAFKWELEQEREHAQADVNAQEHGDAWEGNGVLDEEADEADSGWKPFPLDALPWALGAYAAAMAEAVKVDPTFIAFPSVIFAAGLIGNARIVRLLPTWTEPCVLFGCLVADSSSRKSPSMDRALEPIMELELDLARTYRDQLDWFKREDRVWEVGHEPGTANGDGGKEKGRTTKPVRKRILIGDITMETVIRELDNNPRGLLLQRDELKGWFASFGRYSGGKSGGAELAFWLECFRASGYVYDRKSGEQTTVVIPRLACSVYGSTQPKILTGILCRDFYDSGFVSRILWTMPPKRKGTWQRGAVHADVKDRYWLLMKRLHDLDWNATQDKDWRPRELILDQDAETVWAEWYDKGQEAQADADGDIASLLAKLEGVAARFAGIFAVCDYVLGETDSELISAAHMRNAIRLAEWFRDEAMRVYSVVEKGEGRYDEQRLMEWIEGKGGYVTGRDLYLRNKVRFEDSQEAGRFLDGLVGEGKLRRVPQIPGRPNPRRTSFYTTILR